LKQTAFFLAFLVLALAAAVISERAFSPTFQDCVAGHVNPYDSTPPEQHPPAFKPGSATAYIECTGGFTAAYESALTAVATLVIAAFTGTLWVATSRQAALTEQSLIADKRAFVHPFNLNSYWEQDAATGLYNWRFRVGLKNTGSTPTKEFSCYSDCEVRTRRIQSDDIFSEDATNVVTGFIAPMSDITGPISPISPLPSITAQDIADMQAGNRHIYIHGWMKYRDVFPRTTGHVTRFCWLITAAGDPKVFVPNTPGPSGTPGTLTFSFAYESFGNCADEGCNN
jgi:hypothetical protein